VTTVGTLSFRSKRFAVALAGLMLLLAAASSAYAQTTVTATWDRNTDALTAGYRVYYGTSSGTYQWSLDVGNQVNAPINLSPGSTYYFAVRAYDVAYQYGPYSAEATINLTSGPAPTAQITATMQSATSALVTWQTANATSASINGTAVGLTGSTAVAVSAQTTFTITARAADGRTATASATVTPNTAPPTAQITAALQGNGTALVNWQTTNAVSASINGVSVAPSGSQSVSVSGTTTFTITAVGATGATATASATVTVPTAAAPGVPRAMAASVSGSRVTLNWQPPTTGGAPTHYLLAVGTSAGASNVVSGYNVGNTLRVSGDLPRGTYYAHVRAVNGAGMSLSSNSAWFKIGRKLATPTGFNVQWSGTAATLSWTAPAADASEDVPTGYVLEAGTAPGLSNAATVRVGNVTSFTTDVSRGIYYVRVRAENQYGDSDPSQELEVRAPGGPQAPSRLVDVGSGATVDLRWNASAGGSAATGYVIEAGSAPGLADLASLQVGNVIRFVTNAPPGTYYVRVRGINARGPSAASNEIVVRR
jgi:hypothetical protein